VIRDFLIKKERYAPDKVVVLPNGVDTKEFNPPKSDRAEKIILYIGSMFVEDGLSALIDAISLLKSKREFKLLLIGDGPERPKLQESVAKLGLGDRVTFLPYMPHNLMPRIIKNAYVAIGPLYPSLENYSTVPTKVLEYFACGVPIVSVEVALGIDFDGYAGFKVKAPSPQDIAEKLLILIDNEELAKKLGENARKIVLKKFDWEVVINILEEEIKRVVNYRTKTRRK
jgi:glycosyltransferase involved in cell wall biosynthesis